jgi:16S rRNA (cytidine1402-2'-O)-methyltransferase
VLVLAATPIGRVADAPPRLADRAGHRRRRRRRGHPPAARLTTDLGVDGHRPGGVLLRGQRVGRTPQLLEALLAGERVLLVTDAGMPSVSDPGYRLVAAAVEHDVP